jgi:iron complex outermembrane receptor protein
MGEIGSGSRVAFASLLSWTVLAWATVPAFAQDVPPGASPKVDSSESNQVDDIIITAQRRESTVLKTSGSVTAISGDQLQARGLSEFSSVAATIPGLSSGTSGPGQTEFNLRGVSSPGGNSATVGFYLDDTPLTAAANSNSGKVVVDPNLYDINRVEVLRGPQGTLYGSSSMGGTIRIISNQPDASKIDASAQVKLSGTEGGGFNHTENAMINLPLIPDKLALRLVGTEEVQSGWIHRVVIAPGTFPDLVGLERGDVAAAPVAKDYDQSNRIKLQAIRGALRFEPVEGLSITPSIFYQHLTQDGPSAFDTKPGTLAHYDAYDIPEPYAERFVMGTLNVQYHVGGLDFTSNTAKFSRKQTLIQDTTEGLEYAFGVTFPYLAGPVTFNARDDTKQFSQEFRLASSGDTRFKWLVGAFYSNLQSQGNNGSIVPGLLPIVGTSNLFTRHQPYQIKQEALFGELSYKLTPTLKVTAGLRGYKYDTNITNISSGFVGPTGDDTVTTVTAEAKNSGVNPKFDLTFTPSDQLTLYGTVGKGFRPGGGNQPVPTNSASPTGAQCAADLAAFGLTASPTAFGPDSLWSYEVGGKARLFNRKLSLNASAYQIDWKGIQQGVALGCGFSYTANAGQARIRGAELEVSAILLDGLRLDASAGFIDGKLTQGNIAVGSVAGQPLQTVPRWTGNVGLSYSRPISGSLKFISHAEYIYTGPRVNGGFLTLTPTPAVELVNARIGLTNDRWSVTAFVDNVFNKKAIFNYIAQQAISLPFYDRAATNQPLTAGVTIGLHY